MSDVLSTIRELIPGTTEYKKITGKQQKAAKIISKWSAGETVYSQLQDRVESNRSFYLGESRQQFNLLLHEGELKITANIGAAVIDLIVFLLSNNMPSLQSIPRGTDKVSQVEASIAENLVAKALTDANFHTTFKNTCKMLVGFAGFAWWYPFWNDVVEFERKRNKFDVTLLSPLVTRVFFSDDDYKKVDCFISRHRLTPQEVYEKYGVVALPDSDNVILNQAVTGVGVDDGKVSVFRHYDSENMTVVIDNDVVEEFSDPHGLDFTPLIPINNVWIISDAHGETDLQRFKPIAQELNTLVSAASEIARDKAWPPLVEENRALGGRKITKWRGQKISIRRSDKGEGLRYLISPAEIGPLLEQIRVLLELFHFVSLMPKAAAGIFEANVTSGFQARIAMQPATLSSENKRIDIEESLKRLAKIILYLIEKKDPKALQLEDGVRLKDLHEIDFRVVWPDNLPIDIAREIQNLILGIDSSLTSVTQSIDKYNVMMGMGSTEDTKALLRQESKDEELAPDRVLKLAQIRSALSQIQTATASLREKVSGGEAPPQAGGENMKNLERAASAPFPEEQKGTPETAREAVALESTGGKALAP